MELYIFLLVIASVPIITLAYIWCFYNYTIKGWSKAEGFVVENNVMLTQGLKKKRWINNIVYEYKVGTKFYLGKKPTRNVILPFELKNRVPDNRYPKGETITVYYNPKKPHDSILDNKFSNHNLFLLLIPFSFLHYFLYRLK